MARPSNTEERRRQIVDGLIVTMAEQGYDGASMASVAKAAGLAPGLLHYHFASKLEMLLAAIDVLALRVRKRYERRLRHAHSARERVFAFLDAHVALGADASNEAVACWVVIGAEAVRQPDVQVAYRKITRAAIAELARLITAALEFEARDSARAEQLAAALMAAIYGCYQLAHAAHAAPRGFAAPMLRRMAEGLLLGEPDFAHRREKL
jgi:TetR/AcrR family transcriptional regulator, transcriptional repressor of bet genes